MADSGFHAQTTTTGVAAVQTYPLGFEVLQTAHIVIDIDGSPGTVSSYDGTNVTIVEPIAGGETITFTRQSPDTFATLLFQASNIAILDEEDLDTLIKSLLFYSQELEDRIFTLEP